jgi:hypothetical protein
MNSGGGLAAMTMVEVDDSEDSEDTVPRRGLSMAPGSSAKWGRFEMHVWTCDSWSVVGTTGMEFCRETGAGMRGGSGIEYERCTGCTGLADS